MTDVAKINGVAAASVGKHMGVASANIAKVAGADFPGGFSYPFCVENSCLFVSGDSTRLSRTPLLCGDRQEYIIHGCVKRGTLGSQMVLFNAGPNSADEFFFGFESTDKLRVFEYDSSYDFHYQTDAVFRDPEQHLHILLSVYTPHATANQRVRLWVNGVEQTFSTETDPAINHSGRWNDAKLHTIGARVSNTYFDGLLSQFVTISGVSIQQGTVSLSDFGQDTNGIWTAADLSLISFPTDTCTSYLPFDDAADLGDDESGNSNNWTTNNITSANQSTDSPTNNWCTLNPLMAGPLSTFAEGNLKTVPQPATVSCSLGTSIVDAGKWYWEAELTTYDNGYPEMGITYGISSFEVINGSPVSVFPSNAVRIWRSGNDWQYSQDGAAGTNFVTGGAANGDIASFELDADTGTLHCSINGANRTLVGTGMTGPYLPLASHYSTSVASYNFGGTNIFTIATGNTDENGYGNFEYVPPTGFMALCSANLQDGAGTDPVVGEAVGNEGFVITSDTYDSIVTSLEALRSGWTNYIDVFKRTDDNSDWRVRFSDDSSNQLAFNSQDDKTAFVNPSGDAGTWLGWSWRVGAAYGCVTGTISHTNGGGDSTGAHGLGATPEFCVTKPEDQNTTDWYSYHKDLTANYNILFNEGEIQTATEYIEVDSTNVTIKSAAPTGTYRYIVYAGIEGGSCFCGYEGNAAADGPFVNLGFRPAMFIGRNIDVDGPHWCMMDAVRNPDNLADTVTYIDSGINYTNSSWYGTDIVSNGIKIRNTDNTLNGSGNTHIVMAWAAQPFKYANAR